MKFTFAEKKMDSSEDLRAYAERKIGKLDRFFRNEAEAFVTFSLERGRFRAEITIHNNGLYYRASELTNDMYASVDSGVAAIERQIRRNKTRLEKRLRDGALVERDAVPAFAPQEEEADEEFRIVRSKRFSIKPMSPEEAIRWCRCSSSPSATMWAWRISLACATRSIPSPSPRACRR